MKLAAIATHPIQYQAPLWRIMAASRDIDLTVFFASRHGVEPSWDPGFGGTFAWDIPTTKGYPHEFLPAVTLPFLQGPVSNKYPKGLTRILRSGDFDGILVHGYATGAAWAGILAGWRLELPVLMQGDTHEHGRDLPPLKKRLKSLILKPLLKRIDGFRAIGTWNRNYWESYGVPEEKVATSLYAVDNDFFQSQATQQADRTLKLRRKWDAKSDDVVYLFCAKLISVKAPEALLDAFSLLGEPKARLVFVGTGALEGALKGRQEQLHVPHIYWEGFVNQSELPAFYSAADVLVLPSRFEPWGLVVNEAMACGTPCIVSDVVGAGPDLVDGKGTGLSFRHDQPQALAEAMKTAMDPEVRREWQRNIPQVLAPARLDQNLRDIQTLLQRILQGRAHR